MKELNPAESMLYQLVKADLSSSATLADVERSVLAVTGKLGIAPESTQQIIDHFRRELVPAIEPDATPRLFVDWGDLPRVGNQVRPAFSLICPAYPSRPDISVFVDNDLDHDDTDVRRRPQSDEPGLWSFHVPFKMTSNGLDCRPGQYLIDVEVSFREVPQGMHRFFRCRIRLNVSGANAEESVLEIDGDGQSVVNLQGYNLKQFSKVILKGGQDSVINLQNGFGNDDPVAPPSEPKAVTSFEYQLKLDQDKQSRLPTVITTPHHRAYLDAAGFFFEDGRRTIMLTRPRVTFGRSRDNDIVLRFLPSNEENDGHSRNISRTHFIAELTVDGIDIQDESRSGIEFEYSVIEKHRVVPASFAGDSLHLRLGVTGVVPRGFELEFILFAPDRRKSREELEFWDELICETVGGRLSRVARQSLDVAIDAVRYDRVSNLTGEESYVHLLREAWVGGSPVQCGIVLRECGPPIRAKILHIDRSFWLESLPGNMPISIDGNSLAPRSLIPLSPGMEISIGTEIFRFDKVSQLYLD